MLGAGVFAAFAPAAQAAGAWLLVGLGIAAVVAICNALSSAQLAAQFPSSGGTYVYGREMLGAWPGYIAGWSFMVGKTASCAAMALTFAAYAVPEAWQKPVAAAAVLALAIVNSFGVTRTAALAKVLVVIVLVVLAIVSIAGVAGGPIDPAFETPDPPHPFGVLQSAGILFFAFAGYARVATMGEEVRDPERTIPRAIILALGATLIIYIAVGVAVLAGLGPEALAQSARPLADTVADAGWAWAVPVVQVGAALAALGALLALIAGVGRTSLAMARNHDFPRVLSRINRFHVPAVAELTLGVIVAGIVLLVDVRDAIGFSSFGVLVYYLIANISAFRQDARRRLFPRIVAVAGAIGCIALAVLLPLPSVLVGLAVIAAGVLTRLVVVLVRRRSAKLGA